MEKTRAEAWGTRMNRILFLEALPTISGGQRVLIDLMPALVQQFDATVLVPAEGPLADALRAAGARVTVLPMADYTLVDKRGRDVFTFIVDTPRLALALARLVRQEDARLVYVNNSRAFIWGTLGARLSGRPAIWHAHNIFGDSKTRALVSWFARMKTVRHIICPSDAAAAQFARQRDKVVVVPSGVDLAGFAPSLDARAAKRTELGIASNARVVGIIGDLIPLKGQDIFIQAAMQVARQSPETTFLIVGNARPTDESQHYQAALQSAIRHSPSAIRLLGFQPDIVALLNALDVLVVASRTETGPLVLLQALACGVPVVSTPVGMAPRLLRDGACGRLFSIDDAAALAEALADLIHRPDALAAMRGAARQRAVAELDLKRTQARIAALIAEAVR
ncbi:MAG: glycosyltransferase family 4 protein [Chloroflexota bacterium]|nr:glycosyltransferase family 4 protein [Chloroflexota bacterium]